MTVRQSHPTIHDGSDGTLRTTIFGAPCDAFPHYTLDELQKNYLGCQNIPTKIWLSKFLTKN